jgi:ABC-type uncharacterized transport system permease subunit
MNPVRQRMLYYSVGVVAIAAAWYFVAYTPMRQQIQATNEERSAAEQQLAEYGRIVNELPSILQAACRRNDVS